MEPESLLLEALALQWLKIYMAASNDGLPYPVLRLTDSKLLQCMHPAPYEAKNTCVAVYHKAVSCPGDQIG